MCFLNEDNDLLEKHNTILDKISADFKKEFDREPVYNKKFLKIIIKFHCDKVLDKKIPTADTNHSCLKAISLDSVNKKCDNYYLQVFLKECKYIEKK